MNVKSDFQYHHKILTIEELVKKVGPRPRKKTVIMCHGTFDIVHPGHVRHLWYAKSKADILVVSLTEDKHVIKASFRPYVPEELRAMNLASFEMVDYVLIDRNLTPIETLKRLQPDFFSKGYEYVKGTLNPKTKEEMEVIESYGGEVIFSPGDIVYSSSHLLETNPPSLALEKLILLMQAENLTFSHLREAVKQLEGTKIHVVGDTIVDSLTHCSMIGGMTKTPTMSVKYEHREDYTGGAAVVAKHLSAAGATVYFSTVLGDDPLKDHVLEDLTQSGVHCFALIDKTRPTIHKNAIVVEQYRLLKVDTLDNRSISEKFVKSILARLQETTVDAVVLSDFRHGIFNRDSIPRFIDAVPKGAFSVADTQVASRWGNILDFKGFDLITPNEREARFALGDQDSVIRPLGSELFAQSKCKLLMLKMGERGMIVIREEVKDNPRSFFAMDSFAEQVVDSVGAGDALLAYATLSMIATKNEVVAAILGSLAAAIECEKEGNVPIKPSDIIHRIDRLEQYAHYRPES